MASERKSRHQNRPSSVGSTKGANGVDTLKAQRFVSAAFLVLVLLRFAAAFFPKERLWGLNHLAYLPMWLTVLLTAVALFSCTPLAARFTRDLTNRLYQFYSWLTTKISRTILYILLGLGFALLCWSFPIQFPFLGDGPQSLFYIARFLVGDETSPTSITRIEALTSLVYFNVSKLTPTTTDIGTARAYVHLIYQIAGAASGGLFFFLVLTIAHHAARQVSEKVLVIVTLLGCAGTLFFLAYIEYYTFVYVSIGFYCYAALVYCEGRVRIYVPIVAFLLSVGFHLLALVLLPSVLYLVLSHWSQRVRRLTFRQALLVISISAVVLFMLYLFAYLLPEPLLTVRRVRNFFVPFLRLGDYTYTLLSHYRLIDLVNEWLLVSQIGVVFLAVVIFFLRKKIEWNQRRYVFLLFAAAYMIMLNLSANAAFSLGIDWDIFAAVGLVYTLLGIYLVVPLIQKSQWRWNVVGMVMGAATVSIVPWIMVNVNSDMAVERFKNLIELDAAHLPIWSMEYRYETVRKYYLHQKREYEEFEAIQTLIAYTHGDPKEYDKLFMFIAEKGSMKYKEPFLRAVDSLSHAVKESKRALTAQTDTMLLNEKLRLLYDFYTRFLIFGASTYHLEIKGEGEQFKKSFPLLPQGYEILGWHFFLKEDYDVAMENFRRSYLMDTLRINTLIGLGKTYYALVAKGTRGQELQTYASNALYFYEKALAIQPQPWIRIDGDMGYLCLLLGQRTRARDCFERYLEIDNTSTYAKGIKQELLRLQSGNQK